MVDQLESTTPVDLQQRLQLPRLAQSRPVPSMAQHRRKSRRLPQARRDLARVFEADDTLDDDDRQLAEALLPELARGD